jgi:hypothetical protein
MGQQLAIFAPCLIAPPSLWSNRYPRLIGRWNGSKPRHNVAAAVANHPAHADEWWTIADEALLLPG